MAPTRTILIVDDYPTTLEVWSVFLVDAGFAVLTAADGHEALASATRNLPDLVVLDLELPGLSGAGVARALRTQSVTRHIPLIAATGCSVVHDLADAASAGFDTIVAKPCDPDALVTEIRRLLASSPDPGRSE